ncbi:hypothetical protein [Sediminicoccus sp. KRV36]|uniref:hypothetical protein n=1 Tax=Sediminicoccus sp. KRV36 TaxID=3133721 RepID=UPI00200F9451|nr:hypothetical protein [Sediminicoccus rosea]UPY36630.1 hypothetical protein LHU95_20780 [Sediminicoccus rosea]
MISSLVHISPHLLGAFMLALACVPLVFVWQDSRRRASEKQRMSQLRRDARLAAELRTRAGESSDRLVEGWAGGTQR